MASNTCPSDPGGEKLGVCRELGQTEIGGSREEGGAIPRQKKGRGHKSGKGKIWETESWMEWRPSRAGPQGKGWRPQGSAERLWAARLSELTPQPASLGTRRAAPLSCPPHAHLPEISQGVSASLP